MEEVLPKTIYGRSLSLDNLWTESLHRRLMERVSLWTVFGETISKGVSLMQSIQVDYETVSPKEFLYWQSMQRISPSTIYG